MVNNLPTMQDTQIQSLGWEDAPEKEMASHSSILAWRILWTEEPGGLQSVGLQRLDTTERLTPSLKAHVELLELLSDAAPAQGGRWSSAPGRRWCSSHILCFI